MLELLAPQAPDALLAVMAAFAADPDPSKVDVGVGVYRDATGITPVMRAVRKAEAALLAAQRSKTYVGAAGNRPFAAFMEGLVLGPDHPASRAGRVVALQTPGGCGAVRLLADLIVAVDPDRRVLIGEPTWPNHLPLVTGAGLGVERTAYYDVAAGRLCFEGVLEGIGRLRRGDVALLQVSCHNPTGMDFSPDQWAVVAEALERGGIVPLLDIAYQGLGDGLDADAGPVRMLAERLPEVLIGASCSKNFGLYRERTGCVIVVAADARAAGNALAHMQILARKLYSMPPDHGAAIVATLAADPALLTDWRAELEEMRIRVKGLRSMLAGALRASFGDGRYDYVEAQRGMFSLLGGLTPAAIDRLAREHHVYMPRDGRINIAGLPERAVERVAAAIRAVAD